MSVEILHVDGIVKSKCQSEFLPWEAVTSSSQVVAWGEQSLLWIRTGWESPKRSANAGDGVPK